jgi:hypothetical protein
LVRKLKKDRLLSQNFPGRNRRETQREHEAEQESLSPTCVSRCMVSGNSSNRDNPIKDMINFVNFTLSIVIGFRITAGDSTIYL